MLFRSLALWAQFNCFYPSFSTRCWCQCSCATYASTDQWLCFNKTLATNSRINTYCNWPSLILHLGKYPPSSRENQSEPQLLDTQISTGYSIISSTKMKRWTIRYHHCSKALFSHVNIFQQISGVAIDHHFVRIGWHIITPSNLITTTCPDCFILMTFTLQGEFRYESWPRA
jgi:hypothetical protein